MWVLVGNGETLASTLSTSTKMGALNQRTAESLKTGLPMAQLSC